MSLLTRKTTDGSLLRFLASIDAHLLEREEEVLFLQETVMKLSLDLHKERFKATIYLIRGKPQQPRPETQLWRTACLWALISKTQR